MSPIPKPLTILNNSLETNINSPQSETTFKRLNTHIYKMSHKHTFKDLIHEVSLNKDIHDSFSNIFKSCKSDINNKNNSQDLNKSFSCFSNKIMN